MKPILYTSNTCPNCVIAKEWLTENNIKVEYANINENPATRKKLISMGIMKVPTLVVDGFEPVVGFKEEKYIYIFL